jgi:hypothetical protein
MQQMHRGDFRDESVKVVKAISTAIIGLIRRDRCSILDKRITMSNIEHLSLLGADIIATIRQAAQEKRDDMSVLLEVKIKEAILAVRWKHAQDVVCPNYFVNVLPDAVRLNNSAASWLANFITNNVTANNIDELVEADDNDLDNYSLQSLAEYLEDHGYIVTLPDGA